MLGEMSSEPIALFLVAFKIYDMDKDGFISNGRSCCSLQSLPITGTALFSSAGELFQVLKMMVGSNLKDSQLQQIVDKVRSLLRRCFIFVPSL